MKNSEIKDRALFVMLKNDLEEVHATSDGSVFFPNKKTFAVAHAKTLKTKLTTYKLADFKSELKAKEEADLKAKEEADLKAKEEADLKATEEINKASKENDSDAKVKKTTEKNNK